MGTWNYRVIEVVTSLNEPSGAAEVYRAIHEVHYDEHGRLIGYTSMPATVGWDASEGENAPLLMFDRIRGALAKPVLTGIDFRSNGSDFEGPDDLPVEKKIPHLETSDVSELKGMFGPAQKVVSVEHMSLEYTNNQGEIANLVGLVEMIVRQSGNPVGFQAEKWFSQWTNTPAAALGGRMPKELLGTREGREMVAKLLTQMQSGAYA